MMGIVAASRVQTKRAESRRPASAAVGKVSMFFCYASTIAYCSTEEKERLVVARCRDVEFDWAPGSSKIVLRSRALGG